MVLALTVTSCKKEKETLTKADICSKWVVSENNGIFESIEFTESGNYIGVMTVATQTGSDQDVLFGTYQIIDHETIELLDLGTIKISSITSTDFSFSASLKNDLSNKITVNAIKADVVGSSGKTDLLCRAWNLLSIDEENVPDTIEVILLITKAGTLFSSHILSNVEFYYDLAQWRWKDNSETTMYYSWADKPVWEEEYTDELQIIELTEKLLRIHEDDQVSVFEPITATKSTKLKSGKAVSEKKIRRGLFNK